MIVEMSILDVLKRSRHILHYRNVRRAIRLTAFNIYEFDQNPDMWKLIFKSDIIPLYDLLVSRYFSTYYYVEVVLTYVCMYYLYRDTTISIWTKRTKLYVGNKDFSFVRYGIPSTRDTTICSTVDLLRYSISGMNSKKIMSNMLAVVNDIDMITRLTTKGNPVVIHEDIPEDDKTYIVYAASRYRSIRVIDEIFESIPPCSRRSSPYIRNSKSLSDISFSFSS